jgi:uncharacterized protein (PEP-CTERM system associated)
MGPTTAPMANNRCIGGRRYRNTRAHISKLTKGIRFDLACYVAASIFGSQPSSAADPYDPAAATDPTVAEPQAQRGGLQFKPRITVRETYTDNVALLPGNQKKSDFITELGPGFRVTDKTAHTDLDVDYSLNNLFYARDRDRNTLNHQLRADGKFEFVDNLFFLDSRAQISQRAVSVFGPIGADSSTSNNNETFRSFSLSPYLRKKLGNQAIAEGRYTYSQVNSNASTSAVSDSKGNRVSLSLESGPAYNEFGWGINLVDDRIDYENFDDTKFQSANATGRYRINKGLFLIGAVGYDKNDYFTTGDKPEGASYSLGVDWRPTSRTSFTASAGRRYFGSTYNLAFLHRTRRTAWDISYSQDIQTSRSQFIVDPRETDRTQVEDSLRTRNPGLSDDEIRRQADEIIAINRAGANLQTNIVFVEKKLRGLITLSLAKSEILLNAFDTTRDSETTQSFSIFNNAGDFSLSRVIKQSGIGARWKYRLTARNEASIGLDLSRFRFVDIQRTDNTSALNLAITRKLSREASGSINYRRLQRDSNFGTGEYDENAIFGSITATF